ncbi:response regulator [Schlesneria paludicola]|uniref:response regulator n=1 Tax=Schlesneria paludicola TaxID=360056 RepID=UPI00029B1D79|nr:response regulator [Schlesneria paludicola]
MNALIVDDSRAMRRILRQIVEPLGFQISESGNGIEGLKSLTDRPDTELVLVDWNMPEMNGFEFVKAVRANPAYERIKLVMVTTETEPSKMARALIAGVDEFLMKPFTPEMLLEKLQLIGVSAPLST